MDGRQLIDPKSKRMRNESTSGRRRRPSAAVDAVSAIPTTPGMISGSLKGFLRTLDSADKPLFLPFTATSSDYLTGYCQSNCEAEHRRTGADIVFGWMIWEAVAASFIEAEFHSVVRWRRHLKDITPRRDGEKLILFVPDAERHASRLDERTWLTWSNHKLTGSHLEPTRQIRLQDPSGSNIWPDRKPD